jgi:hypothetical protein
VSIFGLFHFIYFLSTRRNGASGGLYVYNFVPLIA